MKQLFLNLKLIETFPVRDATNRNLPAYDDGDKAQAQPGYTFWV